MHCKNMKHQIKEIAKLFTLLVMTSAAFTLLSINAKTESNKLPKDTSISNLEER